ncbi:hypothetical protein Phpb_01833 [Photorhabdus namnaonensis]|uniref:Uncharacterized protein n=1 Tax=Photorhabdus namnaonensis TaxID=1851568 RepID=A0A1B8YJ80_9GAMM|nr:hypothetical protein Phpb_01833 [Photorhabdus namnaonensis]
MHRDGKGVNPREHSKLCDRGERVQPKNTPTSPIACQNIAEMMPLNYTNSY